ncbi:MAG: histidine kinase [Chitinophagaceae bacterium]|nr:MAG: histidine kinase [Chitinophagaceae bacterium]
MNKEKEKSLNETLDKAIKIGFGLVPVDGIEEVFAQKIMVIGTAVEEKYTSLDGLRKLIRMQQEQSQGMELTFTRTEVYRDYPADGNVAVIVEDIYLEIKINTDTTGFGLRASTIFECKNDHWKMIHWHASKPDNVQSETDTYGIEEWKQKADALEKLVSERTADLLVKNEQLNAAITNLKSTQTQLIQSEKMASLGELTAGIAHEIQNPLNFVNNFSEINKELLVELKEEAEKGNMDEVNVIATDAIANEEKILHHGKRADAIVKGMLQHSRSSSGVKEPTDINALADEYLRLAYHGLRAKDKSFNATLKTDYDKSIGNINIIPQDMGRVILNLITNAFYAVDEKQKSGIENYEPTVTVATKRLADKIEVRVSDNGGGIPAHAVDKIFQPFFTTKPTGQGTGLGLSMSYEIVTKGHGGELQAHTVQGQGTTFIISLPA